MSSVDSRIVTMKFDNAAFESGAAKTMSTMDRLKASLNFEGPASNASRGLGMVSGLLSRFTGKNPFTSTQAGLADLQGQSNRFSMMPMEGAVTGVSRSFLAMSTVAITALANITNKAVDAGLGVAKSFSFGPLMDGFHEYETKIGSVQTILANTQKYGTSLKEVTGVLNDLNHYSDKTIYNFGDMTKNIGLFTNAGIRIKPASEMIKGFSNAAAASGTNAQGAASAAYQLSQALSAGTVRLMDWRSLQNVGMGNKNMQQGIVDIADAMGTLDKAGISSKTVMNDFNGSLEKKWLSADVMSKYLRIMSGDIDAAKMKTMGLSDEQIKMFVAQQKTAEEAATKIRTFTQLVGTVKESIGSGWSAAFETVFGNFNSATDLFTHVNDTIGGYIGHWSNNMNGLLTGWAKLGGRKDLFAGLGNAFNAVLDILKPLREGFRDIFPAKTAQNLADMSSNFEKFTARLRLGDTTIANLKRTFAGVFAVFDILKQILSGVAGMFVHLFTSVGGGQGHFLALTGSIGDVLVALDKALKSGDGLTKFFGGLERVLGAPIKLLMMIAHFIGSIFTGFNPGAADAVAGAFGKIKTVASPIVAIGDKIHATFGSIYKMFRQVGPAIANAIGDIGHAIANAITPETFSASLKAINIGLMGGILLMLKNFMSKGINVDLTGGFFSKAGQALTAVTGSLKAMQAQIKADILMKIALALAVLAASILVLSLIKPKVLAKAMLGITIGFAGLEVALVKLSQAISIFGALKLPFIAAGLMALAASMLILALALKIMATMSWEDIAKGLTVTTVLLTELSVATMVMSKNAGGMIRVSASLIAIGIALTILAGAMKIMATMSWSEMTKGLVGVAGALVMIAGAMHLMPKDMVATSVSLMLIGGALKLFASVMAQFAAMSWKDMIKGVVGIAASLGIIAAAIWLFPSNMAMTAASLVVVGVALQLLSRAVQSMGGMSWEEIAKGLITLAGSLLILAGGLYLMSGALPGAAALIVAAGALAILAPVLVALGAMSWEAIVKGLVTLAAAFGILGLAGLLLGPLTLVIMALSASLLVAGVGIALVGAGALALATAFSIMAAGSAAGIAILVGALQAMMNLLPYFAVRLAQAIIGFAKTIATGGVAFIGAFVTILTALLTAVIKVAPLIKKALEVMMDLLLSVLVNNTPKLANAAFKILIAILTAIRNNISKVADLGGDIIVKLVQGLGRNASKIADAAAQAIIKFVNATSKAIDAHSEEMGRAGGRLGISIAKGMISGLGGMVKEVAGAAGDLAGKALGAMHIKIHNPPFPSREGMKLGESLAVGFANGIETYSKVSERSAADMAGNSIDKIRSSMARMSDIVGGDLNVQPVIAPVLDLSQVKRDAGQLAGLLKTPPVSADVSYGAAQAVNADRQAALAAQAEAAAATPAPAGASFSFEQNNYSPEPLSTIDLYRRTNNQLSQVKTLLNVPEA